MARLGVFLLGGSLVVLLGRVIKPAIDGLYAIMNSTFTLSVAEQATWRAMPVIIPIILMGILIAYLTGRVGGGEGGEG